MANTPTRPQPIDPEDLYTVSAAGFSATADAFARDPDDRELWFLSMVGSQTALKAIWASLLKQPPEPAHLIRGVDGGELTGDYLRCSVPHRTIGTWTAKIARLPVTGGWHALVFTRMAEFAFDREDFLLLARSEEESPALHHRFLDRRSPLPFHRSWAPGCGGGACATGRSGHCSPREYRPEYAPPMSRSSGPTCPTPLHWALSPWRRRAAMDRTLSPARCPNRRRREKLGRAWTRFSQDGNRCRYCPHNHTVHLCTASQPHFYMKATREEARDPHTVIYNHHTPEGTVLVRKVVVARDAEVVTVFCRACAREMGTHQVLCFQRTLATGEVVGLGTKAKGETS